ncbi:hypothetical protein J6G99_02525 [bacterium]|nr:hypothetical protein [bacterium]
MKKFLLIIFALLVTTVSANATTYTKYMAGNPVSVQHGYLPPVPYATYQNNINNGINNYNPVPQHYRYYNNNRRYYNNRYASPVIARPRAISRFDRNYVVPQRQMYVRNGITYYN